MTKKNSGHNSADFSRRKLLQAGAATIGAAAFPMPGIAQTKPFAGVTLRGASFQHRFFTLLQNYIPEFEAQTGMKVDLQLSAFPVYNQQANLELSSGGSAFDFVNVTFILAARWVAAGLLANLDEFTGDPSNPTPAEWKPRDFVEGAQVPYPRRQGRHLRLFMGRRGHGDGPLPHGPDGKEGAEDFEKPSPSCSRSAPRSMAPTASPASSASSFITGACRPTSRVLAATFFAIRPPTSCRR